MDPAVIRAVRAPVEQIVDILIENALVHGAGEVSVEIVAVNNHYRFRVNDEGLRVVDPGLLHTSPAGPEAGLAQATTQAESLGGFVAVGDTPTTRFALVLPRPTTV
jgi:hypothetical protein